MLRHLRLTLTEPLTFLAKMRAEYGDVVQFPIPRPPTYLIGSPDGAYDVLVRGARDFDKGTLQYRSLALVTGDGLLTASNDAWRQQRPVVQPAFHHSLLPALAEVVEQECAALVEEWRRIGAARPSVVDVEAAMMQLSLRVVGRALFGDDLRGDAAALAEATLAALDVVIRRSRSPLRAPSSWPTPTNRTLARSLAELDGAVARLVRQRGVAAVPPGAGPPLLLDLLLASGWTERQVRDQVVTFLVAGHETAASGLTWALWLLAGAPDAQVRCAEDGDYAGASADEALRLYPPAWVITRSAPAEPRSISGRDLPAGALLILSPYLLQRDPRVWPQPDVFRPARFGAGLTAAQRRSYLPFGAGPRLCIGRDFARWEMRLVLQRLCQAFTWQRVVAAEPKLVTGVTLRPKGGMLLGVSRR